VFLSKFLSIPPATEFVILFGQKGGLCERGDRVRPKYSQWDRSLVIGVAGEELSGSYIEAILLYLWHYVWDHYIHIEWVKNKKKLCLSCP
jgi:hypothetical protein